MINIKHPKVSSKPPLLSKSTTSDDKAEKDWALRRNDAMKQDQKSPKFYEASNIDFKKMEHCVAESDARSEQIDEMIKNIGYDIEKLQTISDLNQNIIEPNSCSFERLCSMIDDLEENITSHEISGSQKAILAHNRDVRNFGDEGGRGDFGGVNREYSNNQLHLENNYSDKPDGSSPSTYDDIMSLLGILDNEGYIMDASNNQVNACSKNPGKMTSNRCAQCSNSQGNYSERNYIPEIVKEELETARLQLEEREETLKFLKNELKTQRSLACEKLESQTKQHTVELQAQKTKYQAIIKRHQKFIEQIISDKKNLTEKCNSLTEHIKEMEVKFQRELKVLSDRHGVELQRARELCAASEKIRRERWLEAKTSKIKEMTVKGLEPELRSMVEQHQQELQEIRSVHIKELQDTELRAIRRSNQQLEQLRLELTTSHERTLSNEKEILHTRYHEKLEQQENLFQEQRRKLLDDLEQEKKMLAEKQRRLLAERDVTINQARKQFDEKISTLTRQNQIEKKAFQESLRVEQETWMENCRRQHNMKLEKMESRVKGECNRERDRQIELAIERLEKETLEMKTSLHQSSENRLRCIREKYEAELSDLNDREQLLKSKLNSMQERFTESTTQLQKTEEKLQQCMIQLSNSNRIVGQLTMERNNAKKIVRQEIEIEKQELEGKIASLYKELTENNSNKDLQMAQLYSRVKLIVTQKDLTIGKLLKENEELKKRCEHLEKLLDQQRKDYILRSL